MTATQVFENSNKARGFRSHWQDDNEGTISITRSQSCGSALRSPSYITHYYANQPGGICLANQSMDWHLYCKAHGAHPLL